MTTPRIGPIEGGEDYLGLSPPFIILPPVIHHTCSYAISNAVYTSTGIYTPGVISAAYPTISITPTPNLKTVIFGALLHSEDLRPSWSVGTGYTDLGSGAYSYLHHPFLATMSKVVSSSSGAYTPNGVIGRGILNSWDPLPDYLMIAASIPIFSTSPIQSGFAVNGTASLTPWITLTPPTLGNVIVMIASSRDNNFGAMIPATGWTQIVESISLGGDYCAIWMRCANSADGNNYGFLPVSVEYYMSVSEWTP
jgi:hypothetical protein